MELPITYENDLKMMYSKVVITVLNHINSTITFKKQSNNFFEMAKHFNIPQWIVEIRHDSAHGNELPSVDLMRIVVNILMTWLHVSIFIFFLLSDKSRFSLKPFKILCASNLMPVKLNSSISLENLL